MASLVVIVDDESVAVLFIGGCLAVLFLLTNFFLGPEPPVIVLEFEVEAIFIFVIKGVGWGLDQW